MKVVDRLRRGAALVRAASLSLPGDVRQAAGLVGEGKLSEAAEGVTARAAQLLRPASVRRPGTSSPLRLLIEVESLDRGGLEEVVAQLATRLDRMRFAPQIGCVKSGGLIAERLTAQGIPVHLLNESREGFRQLLERERIDVVNSHYSVFGAPVARRLGIPNLHVLHNSYVWMDRKQAARLALRFRDVTQFVAVSESVARYSEERFLVPRERLTVIPNGVDVKAIRERAAAVDRSAARTELGLSPGEFALLIVGTYERRKGYLDLLRAFAEVARKRPESRLLAAGGAPDASFLERLKSDASSLGISERVSWLPYRSDLSALYVAADVFVLPSIVEGFSLSTLEAAAHGLPVVLTDVGAAQELVDVTHAGRVIGAPVAELARASAKELERAAENPRVVRELAAALLEIAVDKKRWRRRAEEALAELERAFDVSETVAAYEEAFERVRS